MTKILSICIASYNMEKYLPRCVESMLGAGVNDELEIIIVNDGSTDRTLEIANGYKAKYPDTVVVIDKENGHYGSCINASLKVAKGKYFRTVDADDWVDSKALKEFIRVLENNDADCFATNFVRRCVRTNIGTLQVLKAPEWHKVLNIEDLKITDLPTQMHSITWRLQLMKDIGYTQTEGINYSDTEYNLLPMLYAKTIFYCNIVLYQHLRGRENQSISPKVMAKYNSHNVKMLKRFKALQIDESQCNRLAFQLKERACLNRIKVIFTTHIQHNYKDKETDGRLREKLAELISQGITIDVINNGNQLPTDNIRLWYESGFKNEMILSMRRLFLRFKNACISML